MKNAGSFLLLALSLVASGCASNRTNLIAHTGGAPLPPQIRNVSLMPRPSRNPQEGILDAELAAELQRRGIKIVPQSESDFSVSAAVEENWDTIPTTVYPTKIRQDPWDFQATGRTRSVTTEPDLSQPQRVEKHVRTEGIRLRLYRTTELKQGRFQTAWEGYIEAGSQLRPEQQPALLKTLCDYLGRDFIGHVKSVK